MNGFSKLFERFIPNAINEIIFSYFDCDCCVCNLKDLNFYKKNFTKLSASEKLNMLRLFKRLILKEEIIQIAMFTLESDISVKNYDKTCSEYMLKHLYVKPQIAFFEILYNIKMLGYADLLERLKEKKVFFLKSHLELEKAFIL